MRTREKHVGNVALKDETKKTAGWIDGKNTLQVNLCEEASALSPIHRETTGSPPPYRWSLGCLM